MTNQQGAPEALRPEMLDDLIETFATAGLGRHNLMRVELPRHQWAQLAVALSCLHTENGRLAALVEAQQPAAHVQNPAEIEHVAGDVSKNGPGSNTAQQPAPSAAVVTEVENLRKALQFYADKDHFNIADEGAWDTVSGEPQNYWCDEEGTATVEDGTIARLALAGHQIKFDEAPQPAPKAPQQAAPAVLIARSLAEWHEDDGYVAWWAWNGREWAGEPVAWMGAYDKTELYYRKPPQGDVVPLYPTPQPTQAQAGAVPPIEWPKARDVGRIGDMSPSAHMRVGFDNDNDVFVSVWDERGGGSIEFCNPGGGGGGQSSRTRMALIALMVAMEADNAEKPSRDWWVLRMGGIKGGQHGAE